MRALLLFSIMSLLTCKVVHAQEDTVSKCELVGITYHVLSRTCPPINDTLYLYRGDSAPDSFSFIMYNRWGEEVLKANKTFLPYDDLPRNLSVGTYFLHMRFRGKAELKMLDCYTSVTVL